MPSKFRIKQVAQIKNSVPNRTPRFTTAVLYDTDVSPFYRIKVYHGKTPKTVTKFLQSHPDIPLVFPRQDGGIQEIIYSERGND